MLWDAPSSIAKTQRVHSAGGDWGQRYRTPIVTPLERSPFFRIRVTHVSSSDVCLVHSGFV